VRTVLPTKPDEHAVLGIDTRAMRVLGVDLGATRGATDDAGRQDDEGPVGHSAPEG
jgi:hypothetical protein